MTTYRILPAYWKTYPNKVRGVKQKERMPCFIELTEHDSWIVVFSRHHQAAIHLATLDIVLQHVHDPLLLHLWKFMALGQVSCTFLRPKKQHYVIIGHFLGGDR